MLDFYILGTLALLCSTTPSYAQQYDFSWGYRKILSLIIPRLEQIQSIFLFLFILITQRLFWNHCSSESELVFTKSDGTTKLRMEVEKFDHENDDFFVWVKIDLLSSSSDMIVYLYYDKTFAAETNGTYTQDLNYKIIQHLLFFPCKKCRNYSEQDAGRSWNIQEAMIMLIVELTIVKHSLLPYDRGMG